MILPISTSLSCSSGVLSFSFVWNIFLFCLILSNFYFYFYVYGGLVMFLDLGEAALCSDVLCVPAAHSPLVSQGPGTSWSQGRLWSAFADLFHRLPVGSILASGVCPLVGEAGLRCCAGFVEGGASGWNWVLALWWAGPCLGACPEAAVGSLVFRQPVSWWVGLRSCLLVVWYEASQHWSLQAVGWG